MSILIKYGNDIVFQYRVNGTVRVIKVFVSDVINVHFQYFGIDFL